MECFNVKKQNLRGFPSIPELKLGKLQKVMQSLVHTLSNRYEAVNKYTGYLLFALFTRKLRCVAYLLSCEI